MIQQVGHNLEKLWIGTWNLGGIGFGKVDLSESARVLKMALDHGIYKFDTAPIYAKGQSETLLGQFLKKLSPSVKSQILISTKVGLDQTPQGVKHLGRPIDMELSLKKSLARLGVKSVYLVYLHWPDPVVSLQESLNGLIELKNKGYCQKIGLCNILPTQFDELDLGALNGDPHLSLQIKHNPLNPAHNWIQYLLKNQNHDLVAYSILEQGLLLLKDLAQSKDDYALRDLRRKNALWNDPNFKLKLKEIQSQMSASTLLPAQFGLKWNLESLKPLGTRGSCVLGTKTTAQLKDILKVCF